MFPKFKYNFKRPKIDLSKYKKKYTFKNVIYLYKENTFPV